MRPPPFAKKPVDHKYTRALVVPRMTEESVEWMDEDIPDIQKFIYVVDDPHAELKIPKNKGHEGMVYLTYIIDHYDDLPDVVLFFHAHKTTWHNNWLLDYDSGKMISRLRSERVIRMGYMPARCHLDYGCPNWIQLDRPVVDWNETTRPEERDFTVQVWKELFPDDPVSLSTLPSGSGISLTK